MGGKAKGSEFERETCKFLTKWVSGKTKPYIFWRSPSSGALLELAGQDQLGGDIIAVRPEGEFFTKRFLVECKTGYPNTKFHQHFKGIKTFKIEEFWEQTVRDADRSTKYPMMIFRRKGMKPIIGIDLVVQSKLAYELLGIGFMQLGNFPSKTPPVYFYDMDKFFERITPDRIRKMEVRGRI
jgi:hypothetical protein